VAEWLTIGVETTVANKDRAAGSVAHSEKLTVRLPSTLNTTDLFIFGLIFKLMTVIDVIESVLIMTYDD
jgi:hypothetical protein